MLKLLLDDYQNIFPQIDLNKFDGNMNLRFSMNHLNEQEAILALEDFEGSFYYARKNSNDEINY